MSYTPPNSGYSSQPQSQQQFGAAYGAQPGYMPPATDERKGSGVGMASFIIAIIVGIGEFIMVVIAGMMASAPGGMNEEAPATVALGLLLLAGLALALVGAVLGLVSIMQRDRKKIFGILGLIFNAAILAVVLLLMVVGLASK